MQPLNQVKTFKKTILFMVGGAYHPAAEQASIIAGWLGSRFNYVLRDGAQAFDTLAEVDLFVPIGSHFTGMVEPDAGGLPYTPPTDAQKAAFEAYVAAGKPLLAHHGAIVSFDDWPRYGDLLGFRWVRGVTDHPPVGPVQVRVRDTGHPVVAGVMDYTLTDELYRNVAIAPGLKPQVHAGADCEGVTYPVIMTAEGGRAAGAGKVAFLANGHDLRAFECPELRQVWINTVDWLLA